MLLSNFDSCVTWFTIIEDWSNSSQVGRLLGSGINIQPITSLNSFEKRPGRGGYYAAITFLNRPFMSEALKGGLIAAIS